MMNLREKNFILVAPFLSNFEFKIFLHYALLCCTMYYSIQYSTQVEHTVGVAARVSPRREQYVVVRSSMCSSPAIYWHFGHGIGR